MTGRAEWFAAWVNPTPWTAPKWGRGRPYKDKELDAYQKALKDEFATNYPDLEPFTGAIALEFYFWRRLDSYQSTRRRQRRNRADATNLQKATEDALQGVLFANDRDVLHVESFLMAQDDDVEGRVVVRVKELVESRLDGLPLDDPPLPALAELERTRPAAPEPEAWATDDDGLPF